MRFRIDGELREIASPPIAIKDKLASRIKVISRLDISEKRIPQDGRMKLKVGPDRVIDFRVSTLPAFWRKDRDSYPGPQLGQDGD